MVFNASLDSQGVIPSKPEKKKKRDKIERKEKRKGIKNNERQKNKMHGIETNSSRKLL